MKEKVSGIRRYTVEIEKNAFKDLNLDIKNMIKKLKNQLKMI